MSCIALLQLNVSTGSANASASDHESKYRACMHTVAGACAEVHDTHGAEQPVQRLLESLFRDARAFVLMQEGGWCLMAVERMRFAKEISQMAMICHAGPCSICQHCEQRAPGMYERCTSALHQGMLRMWQQYAYIIKITYGADHIFFHLL